MKAKSGFHSLFARIINLAWGVLLFGILFLPVPGCSEPGPPPFSSTARAITATPSWASSAWAAVPADVKTAASQILNNGELVVDFRRITFKPTGKPLLRITTFQPAGQAIRKLVIDMSGIEVDLAGQIKQQETAYRAQYGALDKDLYTKAAASPKAELTAVVEYAVDLPLKPIQPHKSNFRTAVMAAVAKAAKPMAGAWTQAGAKVVWQSSSAPLMHITAQGSVLMAGKHLPGLLRVREFKKFAIKHGAVQSTTDLNLSSVFYASKHYGGGIAVGISNEDAQGFCRLPPHSHYVFGDIYYTTSAYTPCLSDANCSTCDTHAGPGVCRDYVCVTRHGAMVAGMVGHAAGILSPRGAPKVTLYYNNDTTWSHEQQLDWFYTYGVVVENESWTGPPDTFKQDYYPIVGMAISEIAGNGTAVAPASCAANAICVGAYTTTTVFWDTTSTANPVNCSKWVGGTCDLELPHVTFHGGNVTSTSAALPANSMAGGSGTSYAAPAATGLIALMNQQWPPLYSSWPEATRAALMASADRDVHQTNDPLCPTPGKTYSDYHCPDERDGAGVPNAARLEQMANSGHVRKDVLFRDFSFDASGKYIFGQDVYLQQGQRLRAVLSWDVCPTTNTIPNGSANGVHADLDLHILQPNGTLVFNAASYDGGYEIAEIVAPVAGYYRFEVQKFGWQDCVWLDYYGNTYVYASLAIDAR